MSERQPLRNRWGFLHRVLLAAGVVGSLVVPAGVWGEVSLQQATQALATLERGWVENAGQWDKRAAFAAPGYFGTTWVTTQGELRHVVSKREACEEPLPEAREREVGATGLRKPCPGQTWVLSERWVGGKVKAIRGEEELAGRVSYFLGNDPARHRANLASYRWLSLGEVWPGVEVKLAASQKTVEKVFFLRPGANLAQVRVALEGASRLRLSQEGEIVVETGLGELVLSKPVAWQEKDGQKLPVQASYRLLGEDRYGFAVEGADPRLPLVIDPILQSTYLGGSAGDAAYALAIHPTSGEVYVAGWTRSTDFPNTAGGAQASYGGYPFDAFVARLNAALTANLQSTFLGGSGTDEAWALAIHPTSGDVYVAGNTYSTDFPNTAGGAQASDGGGIWDAFVARLNSTLTANLQSTYLGGSDNDYADALAIHPTSGDVYVAGITYSTDFPNTAGGAQASDGSGGDAFVARLNAALTSNLQSTYLGGSGPEDGEALAIQPGSGEVYMAGYTKSTDFPNTAGGAQASYGGGPYDAFVARLNSTLTSNLQSTYLGGSGNDEARALRIHPTSGEVYVAGWTWSTNFPNTAGGAQATYGGGYDAFVARLNSTLTSNLQSTYLGGNRSDYSYAFAIHPTSGEVYVAGWTDSTNFPNTAGGAQASFRGEEDGFVTRLNAALTSNLQSTYLGGSGYDEAQDVAIHPTSGEVYVAGRTDSTNFPNTAGGAQASTPGSTNAFVARLSADLRGAGSCTYTIAPTSASVPASGGSGSVSVTTQAGCSWTASSNASWISITAGGSGSGNGSVSYAVAANSGAARTGTLTVAGQTFTVNQAAAGSGFPYSYWLPSASRAPGLAGSQWRTDLGILNLATSRNDVQLVFYGPSGTVSQSTYVAAGSQSILVDVVGQMGASGNGALEVRTSLPAIVSSRTYNLNPANASCYPNGTLGQNLDAFLASEGLATGQVGMLPQLIENSQYRSNITVTNAGTAAASVKVELYDGSGTKVGEYTESVNPGQFKQKAQPFRNVAGQTNVSRGYAKVTVISGSGVVAVASVIDNLTNDPTTVRMVRP